MEANKLEVAKAILETARRKFLSEEERCVRIDSKAKTVGILTMALLAVAIFFAASPGFVSSFRFSSIILGVMILVILSKVLLSATYRTVNFDKAYGDYVDRDPGLVILNLAKTYDEATRMCIRVSNERFNWLDLAIGFFIVMCIDVCLVVLA